jgi:hypothetical protein
MRRRRPRRRYLREMRLSPRLRRIIYWLGTFLLIDGIGLTLAGACYYLAPSLRSYSPMAAVVLVGAVFLYRRRR